MRPVALTIAGSDSGGGAGIQADLKAFSALGVFGTSAITAITAQNTVGVDAVEVLSAAIVRQQIQSVAADFTIAAAKTGMLANAEIIATVADTVGQTGITRLVADTVMVSKSGHRLLAADAETAMRDQLLPLAFIVTPNLPEAEVLTGLRITDLPAMHEAARRLFSLGAKHVLVKGGHLEGQPAVDLFFDGTSFTELSADRIETKSTHGTGCTLSAAIVAYLCRGKSPLEACRSAKQYLTGALKNAEPLGHGHGPVNHFWNCATDISAKP